MIIIRVSTSNEFNDELPIYAHFEPSTDLNFHIGWYMDTVKKLHEDNPSVYALKIFDYSPRWFQHWDGLDELLTKEQSDELENEGSVVVDDLVVPEDEYCSMDSECLAVCENRIYWTAHEKYSGDHCETCPIWQKDFKELGLECT